MSDKKKFWIQQLLIFGSSILLMMGLMGFNGHKFLSDDNVNQFYPVIQSSFDILLETGHFPLIDFFQMKGMLISDEGYYAQTNGLMFIAYLLEKLFSPHTDCINIYIVLCVALGNVAWNYLLTKMNYKPSTRLFIILMMCGVSAFFSLGYWYYVYNNYIVLPLLLLACYYSCFEKGLHSYIFGAIVLWFSMLLGNIQYTCYHYMVYAIILLSFCIGTKSVERLKIMFSNILFALLFSLPNVMLALNASERRSGAVGDAFLDMSVSFLRQVVFSSIPIRWLRTLFNHTKSWDAYVYRQDFVFPSWIEHIFTGFFFWCFLIFLIKNICSLIKTYFSDNKELDEKQRISDRRVFLIGVLASAVFFELFQMGEGFAVADFLYKIPVINQFRYLFKIGTILPALFAILSAEIIDSIKHKAIYAVIILMIGLGFYNNHNICNGGEHRFYRDSDKEIAEEFLNNHAIREEMVSKGIDLDNYRMVSVINDSPDDSFGNGRDAAQMPYNQKTHLKIYSAGGYENALNTDGYYTVYYVYPLGFNYAMIANISNYAFNENISNDTDYLDRVIEQMEYNGIKYVVILNEESFLQDYISYFEDKNRLDRIITLSNETTVLELKDISPICYGAEMLPTENMDKVRMLPNAETETLQIDTSFTYYEELIAYYEVNGGKKYLKVMKNEYGDASIMLDEEAVKNEIVLTYQKTENAYVLMLGLAASIIELLLFIWLLLGGKFNYKEKKSDELTSDINQNNIPASE